MQKSYDFDLRDVLWRDIFTIFGFKFVFSPEVDKNCWCFICPKIIWSLRLAQSYLKIILSKRQCVLLLHAWWIYVKHSKVQNIQKQETSRERTNLTIKDYSNIKLTIIFCAIYFSFDLDASKSGEVYPAIHRSGCRVLLKALHAQ